jgi:hypothetical protein
MLPCLYRIAYYNNKNTKCSQHHHHHTKNKLRDGSNGSNENENENIKSIDANLYVHTIAQLDFTLFQQVF